MFGVHFSLENELNLIKNKQTNIYAMVNINQMIINTRVTIAWKHYLRFLSPEHIKLLNIILDTLFIFHIIYIYILDQYKKKIKYICFDKIENWIYFLPKTGFQTTERWSSNVFFHLLRIEHIFIVIIIIIIIIFAVSSSATDDLATTDFGPRFNYTTLSARTVHTRRAAAARRL